jgi:hypothetical protein
VQLGEPWTAQPPARSLRTEQFLAEDCPEREHVEHGKEVGASSEPPSGTRPPSRVQYVLTLLNCDSDALIARGRVLAAELAQVDRDTAAVLGIPRVWPDQLPTDVGQVAPTAATNAPSEHAVEVRTPLPFDETMVMRIRSQNIRADAEENALRDAIGKREQFGLPIPQM